MTARKNPTVPVEPADVTPEKADEVIEEIVDYDGRRPVPLSDTRTVYLRMPTSSEDEAAELFYSQKIYEYKSMKVPFLASVARMVLAEVSDPEDFGKRERRITNQEEIERMAEDYRTSMLDWEEKVKTNPEAPKPDEPDYPEPDVEDGSDSLRDIIQSPDDGPFAKTQAIMRCLAKTEYANLTVHTAEYLAGQARTRFMLSHVAENGDIVDNKLVNIKPLWKDEVEMGKESPDVVGFLTAALFAYQQEVLSKAFLQRLSSAQTGGSSKS